MLYGYCTVCRLLRDGVAAVFGPTIAETSRHVEAVCDAVEVPHFRAYWDLDVDDDDDGDVVATSPGSEGGLYSISVYPVYSAVGRSLVDFVVAHDWKSFTVLYDSDQGIPSINQSENFYSGLSSRATARTTKGVTVNE